MAGRRGFGGRSREDLFAEAESISQTLAQLKGSGGRGRGSRSDTRLPYEARWRPDLPPQEEWEEDARYYGGPRRYEYDRFRPEDPREQHHYSPGPARQNWRRRDQDERHQERPRDQGGFRGPPPHRPGDSLTPHHLVRILAQSHNFSLSLLDLLEVHNLPSQQVKLLAGTHGHLFLLQNEEVKLAPRLKLCVAHSSPQGCQRRDTCDSLHMCPKFVLSWCGEQQACVLGHRWHTDHNLAILKRLFMEYVRFPVLRQLLRGGQVQGRRQHKRQTQGESGPLGVCKDYNKGGCDQVHCSSLHVCLSFVVGLTTCSRGNCRLNHDLLSPACCHLLRLHDMPVNEAPRDVAMALLQANPGLKNITLAGTSTNPSPIKAKIQGVARKNKGKVASNKQRDARKDSDNESSSDCEDSTGSESKSEGTHSSSSKGKKVFSSNKSQTPKKGTNHGKNRKTHSNKSPATESDSDSEEDSNNPPNIKTGGNKEQPKPPHTTAGQQKAPQPPKPPMPLRTLWTHDLQGDVITPQICYYSVEGMCRNEATGCLRLHAPTHFHWQVQVNDQNGRWFNLRSEQAVCIEKAFCDPAADGVDLPRLDPSKLESSVRGLFLILGRHIWHADFQTWKLTDSKQSKSLQLRRLCTEPVEGQVIKAATYHWYFKDINNKWVMYGKVDTADRKDLISTLTSAGIEKHYLQNPAVPLTFSNSKFTYVLDLTAMKQTNQSTQVSREVRRRPKPHLSEETDGNKTPKNASDLPQHWDFMQPEERSRSVTLAPTTDEYKKVVALLGARVSSSNVVKVERIQNPFMWRALQNKIRELEVLYKDPTKVDVRQLFHGTSHNVVASICAENFDWRLHGTASGQSYGRGTYFGTDAGLSYGYCRADSNNLKYMFVARVAIGSKVVGNSSMARPPINPATSMPYDSTVDNPTNPRLVVKYSTQEYYPEYLLTLI